MGAHMGNENEVNVFIGLGRQSQAAAVAAARLSEELLLAKLEAENQKRIPDFKPFKCDAKHNAKGHLQPFYHKGRY